MRKVLGSFALMVALSSTIQARTSSEVLEKIAVEGTQRNQAMKSLTELCTKIGGRTTGSPELDQALQWAKSKFEKMGLENVELIQWGTSPITFVRGPQPTGRMIEPFNRTFVVSAPAYSPGTQGVVQADVVAEPSTVGDLEFNQNKYRHRWILMKSRGTMSGARRPDQVGAVEKRLEEIGVAGFIFGSEHIDDYIWTGGRYQGFKEEDQTRKPRVMVRASDYRAMQYQLLIGSVKAEFRLDQKVVLQEKPLYNVVGEIKGTDKPDEMIIVGGHLDSWDTAGSQGASDNGTGVNTAIEAMRILKAVGAKPKRTIRIILWTGEEQGLLGSQADAKMLEEKGLLEKVSAVLNEDAGSNFHTGISAIQEQVEIFERIFNPTRKAFPKQELKVNVIAEPSRRLGGSDHSSYAVKGVPAFQLGKGGPQPYRRIWHTQHDRVEEVVPEAMVQMSTNFAFMALQLADEPELLPRRKS